MLTHKPSKTFDVKHLKQMWLYIMTVQLRSKHHAQKDNRVVQYENRSPSSELHLHLHLYSMAILSCGFPCETTWWCLQWFPDQSVKMMTPDIGTRIHAACLFYDSNKHDLLWQSLCSVLLKNTPRSEIKSRDMQQSKALLAVTVVVVIYCYYSLYIALVFYTFSHTFKNKGSK